MPAPFTTPATATGDQRIDGLIYGVSWSGAMAYDSPDRASDYEAGYGRWDGAIAAFAPLDAVQRLALRTILDADAGGAAAAFSIEGLTKLTVEPAPPGPGAGVLRAANSAAVPTAYAYLPSESFYGGDVWFGSMGRDARAGNADYVVMLHEIGHALGLKHPHEAGPFGAVPLPWDGPEYTVMTYRPYAGSTSFGSLYVEGSAPQTFMALDIAALQELYGANYGTNAGNTVYRWDPVSGTTFIDGSRALEPGAPGIFQTIWDGGGTDTYDLSNFSNPMRIDLAPGAASMISGAQLAYLGGGPNQGYARGNVFNAYLHRGDTRALIENAVGGPGNDVIRGNQGENRLVGGAGHDQLDGRGGADVLIGGAGNDLYRIDAAGDKAVETLAGPAGGRDTVLSAVSLALGRNLENLALLPGARSGAGNGLDNALTGNAGNNVLNGGAGNDKLAGRGGADTLIGGKGADVFRFLSAEDTAPSAFDRITAGGGAAAFEAPGAARGDVLDLRAIDADMSLAGDQAFRFGTAAQGGLWTKEYRGYTFVRGNVDDTPGFDFQIRIEDGAVHASTYTAEDFLL